MIVNTKVVAIIPARGGSKGIPGKNIKLLNGKPLIYYTVNEAKKSKYIDIIAVSTDSLKIMNIVRKYGVDTIKRPKKLATDKALIIPVLKHAIKEIENKNKIDDCIVVLLQPTSPLRIFKDIDMTLDKFKDSSVDSAETFCEVENHPASFFKLKGDSAIPIDPKNINKRRQDMPKLFRESGAVYAFKKIILIKNSSIYGKNHKAVIVPRERSIDIDEEIDFKIVGTLIR